MITYKQVDETYFPMYDQIPMLVNVNRVLIPRVLENGIGGILFDEIEVEPYVRDLSHYEVACEYSTQFDIANWTVFMAFDGDRPVGGITAVSRTAEVNMLDGRDDLCVLWDIRVDDKYKERGIGTQLFNMAIEWSKQTGLRQMKIECQTNNVPACKFYAKHGAILRSFNEYAYLNDAEVKEYEMQVIWYLDL